MKHRSIIQFSEAECIGIANDWMKTSTVLISLTFNRPHSLTSDHTESPVRLWPSTAKPTIDWIDISGYNILNHMSVFFSCLYLYQHITCILCTILTLDRASTCCCEGISPVQRSQKRPSGSGSSPPGTLGKCSWHSGIENPLNLMPSSGSNTLVSVTKPFIPLIPPYICDYRVW